MTSNGEVVGIFDSEMTEGYCSLLKHELQEAMTHFEEAVKLNGQSVYAWKSCAAVKFMLHKNNDAKEFMHLAGEQASRGGFNRAKDESVYPYTSTSENVYVHILNFLTPTILSLMGDSRQGSAIEFKDATLVRQAVEVLPSFCDSQAETILDQEVHAKVTFTPELFRTSENELALTMKLDTVEFGVNGNLKGEMGIHGFFVDGLQFQISPTGLWNPKCVLSSVRPGDEHSAHPVQYTKGGGFQAAAGVGPSPIPTVNAQVNTSQATTTSSCTHGWRRSSKCTSSDHPDHPKGWGCYWELNTYEDGRKVGVHKRVWKTHKLPLDPRNINLSMKSRGYEATWMVPLGVADHVNYKFEFKIAVQASIALVPMILRMCRKSKIFSHPLPFPALVKFPTVTTHCEFSDSVERALPRIP